MDGEGTPLRDPARAAEELTQAAAEAEESGGRLWRLEWAQAFRRLADLGAAQRTSDDQAGEG